MIPFGYRLKILFSNPPESDSIDDLINELGANLVKSNEEKRDFSKGLRIDFSDVKGFIGFNEKELVFQVEEVMKVKDFKKSALNIIEVCYSFLKFDVDSVFLDNLWVKKVDDFDVLVSKIKNKFFKNNSLIQGAADVAVPLTFYDGDNRIDFLFGPMRRDEFLARFASDKRSKKEVPDFMAVISTRYVYSENFSYSVTSLDKFIRSSIEYNKLKVESTLDILDLN